MLTMRQWIAIAVNIVAGNAILLLLGFVSNDPRGGLVFALQLSAVTIFLMFLAFKALRWDASWLAVAPVALLVSFGVPILALAVHHPEAPLAAFLTSFFTSAAGVAFVAPMFVLTGLLLRWGTRERRTSR